MTTSVGKSFHPSMTLLLMKCPLTLVFPPAPKKGMVQFPGKGHFKRGQQAKRAHLSAQGQAKRAPLSPSSKLNVLLSYISLCLLA